MIMKKILAILAVSFAMSSMALADEFTQDVSRLPQSAQDYLKANFPTLKITGVEIDKNFFFVKDYEVYLSNGTVVEFTSNGEWKSIKNKTLGVPAELVDKNIVAYVLKNYPMQKIVSLEKESYGFKAELSSDVDVKFDANGNFIGLD